MSRIIIADDDRMIHYIFFKIIDSLGHDIIKCYNGKEAIEAVKNEPVDLILLDCNMPEMNGYEACRIIRKLPNGITTPIIIISADDSQENILKFLDAGANDYILKPLSESILIAKLKNFLKTSSLNKDELAMVQEKVEIANKYKIQKVLGYGAHSVVFLAEDMEHDNCQVAVKLLNKDVLSDDLIAAVTALSLQIQEADLKNVIEILDFGQYGSNFYIVLEYANGGDLAKQLKHERRLTEKEIIKIGTDITTSLVSLEKYNIIHLDIKPENIMIHDGVYKLSDFGIIYQRATTTMPLNSEIWGTPAYSSPEVLMESSNASIRSDIYSVGVVLYESLLGDNPFLANKPSVSMFRQLNLHPTSLLEVDEKISTELSILIDMMLSKVPSERPSPEDLQKTFTYISSCLDEKTEQQLTYLEKPKKSHNVDPEPKAIEKVKRQIKEVEKDLSEITKVDLHTKSWERGLSFAIPKFRRPKDQHLSTFLKVVIALFVFIVLYSSTLVIGSLFIDTPPKYDFQGIPSTVVCEDCGFIETKPVIDIRDCKCTKCKGQEWYAMQCNECKKIFPLNEDNFNDEDLNDDDDIEATLELQYKCPYCPSSNTNLIKTMSEVKK